MGELKKYDGGVMFSDNDVCDVESLKVRFTPIQSGTGTPSPTNVMPISGYNRFNVRHTGKNVCRLDGWGANNTSNYGESNASNSYGTTVSTTEPTESVVITQTQAPSTDNVASYNNGYFVIISNSLEFDKYYNVSFDVTNIINNPLNATINDITIVSPSDTTSHGDKIVVGNRITIKNYRHKQGASNPTNKINQIEVRICGLSCTISNLLITKVVDEDTNYEEYNGENFVVNSPIVGKNLADIYGIGATNFATIYSKPEITNSYGTSIVVSENNNKVVIAQSQAPNTSQPWHYQNGYIYLGVLGLTFGKTYKISFRVSDIVSNPLNTTISDIKVYSPSGSGGTYNATIDTDRVLFIIPYNMFQSKPYRNYFEIRNCGMSCTLSDFMVTEADVEDQTYEPYKKTMYGGYIDFVKGEYVQEWAYETDNGGTWYVTSVGNAYQWGHSKCSSKIPDIKSTHWKTTQGNTNEDLVGINTNSALYIGKNFWNAANITPTPETVAAYFQAQKEAGTPFYCCCKLLEPIHHPLTPLQLQTYAGINNIWCEANGEADIWYRNSKPISTEVEESVTGDTYGIANFTTKSALPLEKCKVGFEFSQDLNGYSKPWAGGAGKNLYDADTYPLTDGRWISGYDGVANSTSNLYAATLNFIPCNNLQNKTLTLNKRSGGENPGVAFYTDKDMNTFISGARNLNGEANTPMTFEVPSTANYMRFTVPSGATDIQIEIGETATSYEPYANVCPINGTSEFNVVHTGKNLAHVVGYSAQSINNPTSARYITGNYGTTLSTVDFIGLDGAIIITQSQAPDSSNKHNYTNGYFNVVTDNLVFGKRYNISFKITDIISNPLDATLSDIYIGNPYGTLFPPSSVEGNKILFKNYLHRQLVITYPKRTDISIYFCGMSCTISEFMVTPVDDEDVTFEPYRSETIPVKLPALGKNIAKVIGYSTGYPNITTSNSYTSISTTDYNLPDTSLVVTSVGTPSTTPIADYHNGYFFIKTEGLEFNKIYNVSFKITNIIDNPLNATLSNIACVNPNGTYNYPIQVDNERVIYKFTYLPYSYNGVYEYDRNYFDIRNCGMSCTISEFMVTEADETDTTFEPFNNTVYSGYLDMSSGELTLDWVGATRKLSQANSVTVGTNYDTYSFNKIFPVAIHEIYDRQLCSIAPYQWEMQSNISHFFMHEPNNNKNKTNLLVFLPHDFDTDVEFTVAGKPDNPITYQLTPQQITAFRGMNNIYQTASNSIEIDYKDMNHNELDLIGLRRGVLLNTPHTESIENDNNNCAVSFDTDMVAPLKNCKINLLPKQLGSGTPSPSNVRDIIGYSDLDLWSTNDNLLVPEVKTNTSNGLTWTVNEDGSVNYEGTPTAFSGVSIGYAYVFGATQIMGKIIGDNNLISFDTLYLYDENNTRIAIINSFERQTWGDSFVTVDISEYPTAYRALVFLKRYSNDIYMSGKCYVVIKTDSSIFAKNNYISLQQIKKNLFNINVLRGLPSNENSTNAVKRIFEPNTFIIGTSGTNYYSPSNVSYAINGSTLTINTSGGYGLGYTFHLKPNTRYIINATFENEGTQVGVGISSYSTDGTFTMVCEHVNKNGIPFKFTTPSDSDIILITFKASGSDSYRTDIPITNIQLEEGNTATEYTEYRYPTYGGYVDLEKNELAVQYIDFPISEIKYFQSSDAFDQLTISTDISSNIDSIISNQYSTQAESGTVGKCSWYLDRIFFNIPLNQLVTKDNHGANTWYQQYHPQFIAKLKNPIIYQLTPQQVLTLRGENNLFTTGDSISSEYWTHKDN